MKVFELIDSIPEKDIYERIKNKENNNLPLFNKVYCELKGIIPYINDIKINLKKANGVIQVFGVREGVSETIPLEFYSWQSWLGMSINEKLIKNESDGVKVLENILHEMTFVGFKDPFRKSDNECILKLRSISKSDYEKYGLTEEVVNKVKEKIKNNS